MATMKTSYKSKRKKGYKTCKKRSKLIFKTVQSQQHWHVLLLNTNLEQGQL